MTSLERYQLRVHMEDFDRGHAYAQYSSFHIDPESKSYALHVSDYINGGAGDQNITGYDLPADIFVM